MALKQRPLRSKGAQACGSSPRSKTKNLRRMVQFAQAFPDPEKVASLMRQLTPAQVFKDPYFLEVLLEG